MRRSLSSEQAAQHQEASQYDDWEDQADDWGAPEQGHAWEGQPEAEQHEHEQPAEHAEAWDEQQQHQPEYWDQQEDPWAQDDAALSADLAGMHLASAAAAEQPEPDAWQHVEPAPSAARPPVGSPLCPEHFASGECQNEACELVHGDYCEVRLSLGRRLCWNQVLLPAVVARAILPGQGRGSKAVYAQTCGRMALHPEDAAACSRHQQSCQERWRRHTSQQITGLMECSICLEVWLVDAGSVCCWSCTRA